MPYDITIEIIHSPATHDLPADGAARRYRQFDIVEVWPRARVTEPPSPNSKFWFIHVAGIPDTVPFEKVRSKLLAEVPNPLIAGDFIRRRRWRVHGIPSAALTTLQTNKEITVPFTTAKNYIKRKVANNATDPTQDTLEVLTDQDLA